MLHLKDMDRKNRTLVVVMGIFLCAAGGVVAFTEYYPRSIVITNADRAVTSTAVTSSATTSAAAPVPAPVLAAQSFSPVDAAAYDAKMLQIANLAIVRHVTKIKATSSTPSSTIVTTSTIPLGWPVNTVYPDAGALLPFNRIIAYYGNLYSKQMGVLGQYPPAQVLAMLASTTVAWQAADPATPAIPALDYIVVTAQGSPGADGDYRLRMPASQIDQIIQMAAQAHGIVFLDIQVGLSTVEQEVPLLEAYLKMPQVHLALDPEFDMHNGRRPGTVIGTMDASDINWAANYLANLVKEYDLPPKMLVIHRFTEPMVTNYKSITPLPEVQIVMDMDGFGPPAQKQTTYTDFIQSEPVQFTGFKLFYHNDTVAGHMMTPDEVLKLSPQPSYIQYE